jgi:ABC-2 type transport system ATP-binding protein
VIQLSHARRQYGGRGGITDVSLTVPRGSIYVLSGANGAGKTTAISVLAGLLFAETGALTWNGAAMRLDRFGPREGLGFVPDTPILDADLTGWQWLAFTAAVKGHSPVSGESLADDFNLTSDTLSLPIRMLSFGNQRRVALWAEMATSSRVLLLDEPLIGLDPLAIERFRRAAIAFVESGRSIVLSTHLLREAEILATHVGIIHGGVTVREGSLDHVCDGKTLQDTFLSAIGAC